MKTYCDNALFFIELDIVWFPEKITYHDNIMFLKIRELIFCRNKGTKLAHFAELIFAVDTQILLKFFHFPWDF